MPSAWRDKSGYWCARWRGYEQRGSERTIRRPAVADLRRGHEQEDALAWAYECERYCRRLEQGQVDDRDIEHARRIRAISSQQARALLGGDAPGPDPDGPAEIVACWKAHPSTVREYERRPAEFHRHERELQEFLDWSGKRFQRDVSCDLILLWVEELRRRGLSWDGRRHRLLALRRASTMGAVLHGIADALPSRLRIDRRGEDEHTTPEGWEWDEVWRVLIPQTIIRPITIAPHWKRTTIGLRHRLAVALGAGLGLRPSEIGRLEIRDWQRPVLEVGARARKNRGSWRLLPMPPTIAAWLDQAVAELDGKPTTLILAIESHRCERKAFSCRSEAWGQWCATWLPAVTGRALPAKCMRKTFTSAATAAGIREHVLEPWIGHMPERLAASTRLHYLLRARLHELQPLADAIEQWIRAVAADLHATASLPKSPRKTRTRARLAS